MKTKSMVIAGMLACLMGESMACGHQPAPTPAPAPAKAAQPGGGSKAFKPDGDKPAQEAPTCDGPDGKKHTFPLSVYDENADPEKTIADAIAKAKSENKRVLVMWGENWCQFCLYLEDILAHEPSCAPLVKSDYVWVRVDLGKGFTKNRDIAERYGVMEWTQRPNGKMMGAPSICIIDPDTGMTVGDNVPALGNPAGALGGNDMVAKPMTLSRLFDEKIIKEHLITWRAPAKPAQGAMNDAIVAAKRDSKKILALFTMPNDDACQKALDWMSRPDAAAALGNSFVTVKIDTERMIGGREMLAAAAGKPMLPPFICVLDDAGKSVGLATQFTALPKSDAEIEAFLKGLSSAAKIADADKAVLTRSLKDAAVASADTKK
jgi:hypothetical protein